MFVRGKIRKYFKIQNSVITKTPNKMSLSLLLRIEILQDKLQLKLCLDKVYPQANEDRLPLSHIPLEFMVSLLACLGNLASHAK